MFVSRKRQEKTVFGLQASKLHISVSKQHFGVFLNKTCIHRGLLASTLLFGTTNLKRFLMTTPDTENIWCADFDDYHVRMRQSDLGLFVFFLGVGLSQWHTPWPAPSSREKKARRRVWALFVSHSLLRRSCTCDGTTNMQHPGIFGRRHDAGACVGNRWDRWPGSSKASASKLKLQITAPSSDDLLAPSSSSPQTHRLSIFHHTHSTGSGSSLTGCPSLDNALASFDALLLESRVVCCEKMHNFFFF